MGSKRHLSLLSDVRVPQIAWPVPFADGIARLKTLKGQRVAVLASGDPFWFGAGSVIARHFAPSDWRAFPGRSTFSLAASRLGWALEKVVCLGLHALPLTQLRPHLAAGRQMLVLLRNGEAVQELADYLEQQGFGQSTLTAFEALGGLREKVTRLRVQDADQHSFAHPVCVAVEVAGIGPALPCASGLEDRLFESDGVMTKRPVRAITLSSLAPKPGELLWDIGAGSGSVAIEWLLSHPACRAIAIEPRADRVALIKSNAQNLGADRLEVVVGQAPDVLAGLAVPDAVFIGGGVSEEMIGALSACLSAGTRVVANAVTLEGEALLTQLQTDRGGGLMRIEIATGHPLGSKRGWKPAYPVVQWSGVL